jgi:2-phospho-L-lactate guanylyltransferase (CobY/MobA/RfbA family)
MQAMLGDIYRAAARARWIGQVVATSADEPVEAAAIEFSIDAWKVIAVAAYEIA